MYFVEARNYYAGFYTKSDALMQISKLGLKIDRLVVDGTDTIYKLKGGVAYDLV